MTVKEAQAELSKPLVFGNEAQIKASDFLEQVHRAKAWMEANPKVKVECRACSGTGHVTCDDCDGEGEHWHWPENDFRPDVIAEAEASLPLRTPDPAIRASGWAGQRRQV